MLPDRRAIEDAAHIVYAAMPATPQYVWPRLCELLRAQTWVKHENHTPIGAFKLRGGLVYCAGLRRRAPGCRGVVAATRGNHGQSIAFAARRHGLAAALRQPEAVAGRRVGLPLTGGNVDATVFARVLAGGN
jgi:threonine dehydratase